MFKKVKFISSVSSVNILLTLAADPMRTFYQREVSKEASVSVGSANRILKMLTEKDLVLKEKRGKVFLYRFNLENPVARQLKILFNVDDLNDLVMKLKTFCKRIVLFGSCAEGTDVKDSDIDIFILTDQKSEASKMIKQYEKSINRNISLIIVNANEFVKLRSKDKPLYERIVKGITLWQVE